ncbi:hypothetical protein BD626DRAFT_586352 [Schizophyllum amplum]|uniref:Uncharacterized protein n=1 Tax=Schizophyllum amplum TaxID=97359 RepID=A0A550BZV3_9AGAR|nr:hypothetical protein BD626DRAFT_586352 [Auriculariopsis ampla]
MNTLLRTRTIAQHAAVPYSRAYQTRAFQSRADQIPTRHEYLQHGRLQVRHNHTQTKSESASKKEEVTPEEASPQGWTTRVMSWMGLGGSRRQAQEQEREEAQPREEESHRTSTHPFTEPDTSPSHRHGLDDTTVNADPSMSTTSSSPPTSSSPVPLPEEDDSPTSTPTSTTSTSSSPPPPPTKPSSLVHTRRLTPIYTPSLRPLSAEERRRERERREQAREARQAAKRAKDEAKENARRAKEEALQAMEAGIALDAQVYSTEEARLHAEKQAEWARKREARRRVFESRRAKNDARRERDEVVRMRDEALRVQEMERASASKTAPVASTTGLTTGVTTPTSTTTPTKPPTTRKRKATTPTSPTTTSPATTSPTTTDPPAKRPRGRPRKPPPPPDAPPPPPPGRLRAILSGEPEDRVRVFVKTLNPVHITAADRVDLRPGGRRLLRKPGCRGWNDEGWMVVGGEEEEGVEVRDAEEGVEVGAEESNFAALYEGSSHEDPLAASSTPTTPAYDPTIRGPSLVILHHFEWCKRGIDVTVGPRTRRARVARETMTGGAKQVTKKQPSGPAFPAAEGFFYWYEPPSGSPYGGSGDQAYGGSGDHPYETPSNSGSSYETPSHDDSPYSRPHSLPYSRPHSSPYSRPHSSPYDGPDGPPGIRFRIAPKGVPFEEGVDWVPEAPVSWGGGEVEDGDVHDLVAAQPTRSQPWVMPAWEAVRRYRLFPWLRADGAISPTVDQSARAVLHRDWTIKGLNRRPAQIVNHLLPANLTDADRIRFPGCTAAAVVAGAPYGVADIPLERRRIRAGSTGFLYFDGRVVRFRAAPPGTPFAEGQDVRAGYGRWRLPVPPKLRAAFAERLVREGLPEAKRDRVVESLSGFVQPRKEVGTLDPEKVGEADRLELDGFKYYEVRVKGIKPRAVGVIMRWGAQEGRRAHKGVSLGFPTGTSGFLYLHTETAGGGIHAGLRFRVVPPGEPFSAGHDLERPGGGDIWRLSLRLLAKWHSAAGAALVDAGHIPRDVYAAAQASINAVRLGQGMVLNGDYTEDGQPPLRWRYPSIMRKLRLRNPRMASLRRSGPRRTYPMRRALRLFPPRLPLKQRLERWRVSTLDPAKLTDADRVDVRDARFLRLRVAGTKGTATSTAPDSGGPATTSDEPATSENFIDVRLSTSPHGRFPLNAVGFVYWHDPPDRPPWGGALRFRIAPAGTPFADGVDLMHPTLGIPLEWGVVTLARSVPGAIDALAAAGRIPRGVLVHARAPSNLPRGWARTMTNVRDPVILYLEGLRDVRVLTGDGVAHQLRISSAFRDMRLGKYVYSGWVVARFEHAPEDGRKLRLRIVKLLSAPKLMFADYDGYVPPPREGELVMMNTDTPWEFEYSRQRPFKFPSTLDLFWEEKTCRADYVREVGGEERWMEDWVQGKRGRRKIE